VAQASFARLRMNEGVKGSRVERQGFGEISDRQKKQQLAKLDSAIATAEAEAREEAKVQALREVEERFSSAA
jgi:hypothetical protein